MHPVLSTLLPLGYVPGALADAIEGAARPRANVLQPVLLPPRPNTSKWLARKIAREALGEGS